MKCKKGHKVTVLRGVNGFYWGTLDPDDGTPYCRISTGYVDSVHEASNLKLDRQITCMENYHCNGGEGCFNIEIGV